MNTAKRIKDLDWYYIGIKEAQERGTFPGVLIKNVHFSIESVYITSADIWISRSGKRTVIDL